MGLEEPGFSAYIPLAYPSPTRFLEVLEALVPCTDFFEIGLPSQKPKYDGPTIRKAHIGALEALGEAEAGGRLLSFLETAARILRNSSVPYVLMTYYSDHRQRVTSLLEAAGNLGAGCVLFPDLLFDHYDHMQDYIEGSREAGMKPCFFASSRFPHRLLAELSRRDPLFIYMGLQPTTGVELPIGVARNLALARKLVGEAYLLAGFAVKRPQDAQGLVRAGASGVVVGTALLERLEKEGPSEMRELACRLRKAVKEASMA